MTKFFRVFILMLTMGAMGTMLSACEEEGPGEKMGKQLDHTIDDMKDAIE